ncbi:MAG: MarR family winged helix-turn-helix transcriptional regulator [Steroidobacteraceae bacterium]
MRKAAAMSLSDLTPYIDSLRDYYSQHRSIPPLSGLAHLWGYRAKSWAAAIVAGLKQQGIVETAPGRRLRPGPQFPFEEERAPYGGDEQGSKHPSEPPSGKGDPIEAAAAAWATEVPGTAAEAYALVIRIVTLAGLIEHNFQLEAHSIGLSAGEVMVLDALRRLGPPYESSAALLKDHFLISFAGIGKRVQRLERLGYVVRRVNPGDRRSQTVRLTASALALLRKRFRNRYAKHVRAVMQLPATERQQLARTLRRLQQRMRPLPLPDAGRRLHANNFTE